MKPIVRVDAQEGAVVEGTRFEAMQFVEPAFGPGEKFPGTMETRLGFFTSEDDAIDAAKVAWVAHRASGSHDVAWWIVRVPGESMARWIADAHSPIERVLDLTSKELVEVDHELD
jgi:hypothetical protein